MARAPRQRSASNRRVGARSAHRSFHRGGRWTLSFLPPDLWVPARSLGRKCRGREKQNNQRLTPRVQHSPEEQSMSSRGSSASLAQDGGFCIRFASPPVATTE